MKKKILLLLTIIFTLSFVNVYAEGNEPSVIYSSHVQTYGWQNEVKDGAMSGTEGQFKRLEGIKIKLNSQIPGSVEYATFVQTYKWQGWKKDGAMSGTEGLAKRMEAIKIKLTGEISNQYDIYYRVHSQTYGWLGWAKNGEIAGTIDKFKRLEGIEIKLVKKGTGVETGKSYVGNNPSIIYSSHVQSYGWQPSVADGKTSGTTGKGKRLEAIKIQVNNNEYIGNVKYQSYINGSGWERNEKNAEDISGTVGQRKSIGAIKMYLTDELAEKYDIYYRVHSKTFGWLGWAKNGEVAGTTGYDFRVEAIEIKLVKKGTGEATGNSYQNKETTLSYQAHVQSIGNQNQVSEGSTAGTVGQKKRIEAIKINANTNLDGNVIYRVYNSDDKWSDSWITDNSFAGVTGQSKPIYLIEIKLTGKLAEKYDIYYRVHSDKYGWLGWAKNGESAGATYYDMQAIQIKLYLKEDNDKNKLDTSKNYIETGFFKQNGNMYYNFRNGKLATGWNTIMGVKYYFNVNGEMLGKNVRKVIDVSAHNYKNGRNIDWDKLYKSHTVDGVIVRVGYDNYEDKKFEYTIKNLKRLGIPYGIYLYNYAEEATEGRRNGQFVVDEIKKYSLNPTLGIYFDLESNNYTSHLSTNEYDGIVRAFMDVMNNNGYGNLARIYTYRNYARDVLNNDYLKSKIYWVAEYNSRLNYSGPYSAWQYTSTDSVPGITGAVDSSVWYANF